jgi:hypothetical protein
VAFFAAPAKMPNYLLLRNSPVTHPLCSVVDSK